MELVRRQVTHRKFGAGTVTGFDGRVITVFFEQYGSRSFRYPDAFADGLRAVDEEVRRWLEENGT